MRVNYSGVTATLALVLAISTGGAYAANTLVPKNSVTSKAIKNGQVKTKDLGKNTVTGAKVRTDALTGADLKESTLGKVPAAAAADRATLADRADLSERATLADRAANAVRSDQAALADRALAADRASNVYRLAATAEGVKVAAASSPEATVSFVDPGVYTVGFGRPLGPCSVVAGIFATTPTNFIGESVGAFFSPQNPNVVSVRILAPNGQPQNMPFALTATC
jgi:hypothetical protein